MEDLSKFLPLYFGGVCQIVWTEDCSENTGLEDGLFRIDGTVLDNLGGIESCKIHCRPLSSLTEEESKALDCIGWETRWDKNGVPHTLFQPEAFIKLIEWGFDIFGLKEKGLALYPEDL